MRQHKRCLRLHENVIYIVRNVTHTELPTRHCVDKIFLRDVIKAKMN